MSPAGPQRGRHARRGTFARDVTVASVLFVVAALGMFYALSALLGGDGSNADSDVVVAGITVTSDRAASQDTDSGDGPSVTSSDVRSEEADPSTTAAPATEAAATEGTSAPASTGTPPTTEPAVSPVTVPDPSTIRVQVLNAVGTTGLASRVSGALAAAGYQMLPPDDTENRDQSRILFREPFGPAAFELAARFPDAEVGAGADLASDVDIVIELGASYREE